MVTYDGGAFFICYLIIVVLFPFLLKVLREGHLLGFALTKTFLAMLLKKTEWKFAIHFFFMF